MTPKSSHEEETIKRAIQLLDGSLPQQMLKNGIANAKNYLAKQTWARKTWQQRVGEHPTIAVISSARFNNRTCTYYSQFNIIRCETLSQSHSI